MSTNPRVLIVTPVVTYLPPGMGDASSALNAKAGGLGDVSAALINALECPAPQPMSRTFLSEPMLVASIIARNNGE